jgi:trimethylamine--corrinoid protein Co-methyltransferase
MISGAGMLDFLACQSVEKLVFDAEAIGMVKRLLEGMKIQTETLATAMFEGINFKGDFLKQRITRELFAKEQYLPSSVIDRASVRAWQADGGSDAFTRAKTRSQQLLSDYKPPFMEPNKKSELQRIVETQAHGAGVDHLPELV